MVTICNTIGVWYNKADFLEDNYVKSWNIKFTKYLESSMFTYESEEKGAFNLSFDKRRKTGSYGITRVFSLDVFLFGRSFDRISIVEILKRNEI